MATRLVQILTFTNVADAATIAQAHSLNINGVAIAPDCGWGDAAGFDITADAANVSVTNNSGALATIHVYIKREHSITRQIGGTTLTPVPFFATTGSGGGGATVVTDDSMYGDGSADPLTVRASRVTRYCNEFMSTTGITSNVTAGGIMVTEDPSGYGFGAIRLNAGANNDAIAINMTDGARSEIGRENTRGYIEWRVGFTGTGGPTAIKNYRVRLGLSTKRDPSGGADIGSGLMFAASFTEFANSNWQATIDGTAGARTINTGVAPTGGWDWQTLRIEWESDALGAVSATWFINDVQVAQMDPIPPGPTFTPQVSIVMEYENVLAAGGSWLADFADLTIVQDRTIAAVQ